MTDWRQWRPAPGQAGLLVLPRTVADVPDQDTGQDCLDRKQKDKILRFSRSANEEQCKNCPEQKVTKGEKNTNKKKKKAESNKKKKGKKGRNKNRADNKKNKRTRIKGGKTANKERPSETKISRYEETELENSKTEVIEDFGPFGNLFKSLVTRNTYL